jgi:hypothetical protein
MKRWRQFFLCAWCPVGIAFPKLTMAMALCAILLTGCGSGSEMQAPPPPAGNTNVVVLLTSTANDQLVSFTALIQSIALVNNAGTSITIFNNPQTFSPLGEWMHLNGASSPLPSVSVPQGSYTSAVVTVYGCSFTNMSYTANGFLTSTFAEGLCAEGSGLTTVNLPNPIAITGSAMALSLDLQVSQSYTLDATAQTYTIDPLFTLTPVSIAPQPTDETNGKVTATDAQVISVSADGTTFTTQTVDSPPALTIVSNASTVFQGISGAAALAPNMLFSFDAAIQSDGSLLATRIEVDDPTAVAGVAGPFTLPVIAPGVFSTLTQEQNGCTTGNIPFCGDFYYINGTVFNISGELTNLASLPFAASFSNPNFFQGQEVQVTSSGVPDNQSVEVATGITLLPQTLNGTVSAVTNDSGFAVYTVTLAPYDLIPVLQNFTDNTPPPHLTNPTTILVYADTSTSFLNSGIVDVGSLIRCRGVIFDDNGTMRMDATTIYDGVAE